MATIGLDEIKKTDQSSANLGFSDSLISTIGDTTTPPIPPPPDGFTEDVTNAEPVIPPPPEGFTEDISTNKPALESTFTLKNPTADETANLDFVRKFSEENAQSYAEKRGITAAPLPEDIAKRTKASFDIATKNNISFEDAAKIYDASPEGQKQGKVGQLLALAGRNKQQIYNQSLGDLLQRATGEYDPVWDKAFDVVEERAKARGDTSLFPSDDQNAVRNDELYDVVHWLRMTPEERAQQPEAPVDLRDVKQYPSRGDWAKYAVAPPTNKTEKVVDFAASIESWILSDALLKKAMPSMPSFMRQETINLAHSGTPGFGVFLDGTMSSMTRAAGYVFPKAPVKQFIAGTAGASVVLGGTTYAMGGDTDEVLMSAGLPLAFSGLALMGGIAGKYTNPEARIQYLREKLPLADKTNEEILLASDRLQAAETAKYDELLPKVQEGDPDAINQMNDLVQGRNRQTYEFLLDRAMNGDQDAVQLIQSGKYRQEVPQAKATGDTTVKPPTSPQDVLPPADVPPTADTPIESRATQELPADIKYAKRPDGTLKNKDEYTPEEWANYTQSVIDQKTSNLSKETQNAVQQEMQAPQVDNSSAGTQGAESTTAPTKNKLFTEEKYQAAKVRQAENGKLKGGKHAGGAQLLTGQDFADALTVGGYHLEKGLRKFADWSTAMLDEYGEKIRPHLQRIWGELKQSTPELVDKIDTAPQKKVTVADLQKASIATESNIEQLRTALDAVESPEAVNKPILERVKEASDIGPKIGGIKDSIIQKARTLKLIGQVIFDDAKRGKLFEPIVTDFTRALGEFQGSGQIANIRTKRLVEDIANKIPDMKRQQAISHWIQANGDDALLAERARQLRANPDTEKFAGRFELARQLTDSEKQWAREIKNVLADQERLAKEAGIFQQGRKDYLMQIWGEKDGEKLSRQGGGRGVLQPNPSFTKEHVFDSYFDGMMAGYSPKDDSVGKLVAAYQQSFLRGINSRAFVKKLPDMTATDGRPVVAMSGARWPIADAEGIPQAYMLSPNMKTDTVGDYERVSHPSLSKWVWTSTDAQGRPTFEQRDLLIHPEYVGRMKSLLGESWFRTAKVNLPYVGEVKPFNALLTGMQTLKGTMLSLSGFHQVQEATHAVFHKVNPFFDRDPVTGKISWIKEINPDNPLQRDLINGGLIVADYKNLDLFSEGMAGGGLLNKIPGAGKYLKQYTDYLFSDYIPRLKMKMATEAYARNAERYSNLSHEQIVSLTADQANAAFGELNYAKMGRNKTFQDFLRVTMLAPDFLEARGRFAGQGMKSLVGGYGKEQAAALIRGTAIMYAGARIANYIFNDGDPEWDKPFSVIIGDNEYSLRSVPGDIYHLITKPDSFLYVRLNPWTVRPVMEGLTGRNQFGQYRDTKDQALDYLKSVVPLPLQGISVDERKIWRSILSASGLAVYKHKSEFERSLTDIRNRTMVYSMPRDEREKHALIYKYADDYKQAIISGDAKQEDAVWGAIDKEMDTGKLDDTDIKMIEQYATEDHIERIMKGGISAEDVLRVWHKASPSEKEQYYDVLLDKIDRLEKTHPSRYEQLLPQIDKIEAEMK